MLCTPSFSQAPKKWEYSYTHRYFSIRDGLVQSQALLSFQDSFGYLWFSTYEGVSRFDGLVFDNFTQEELDIAGSRVKFFNQYESAVYMLSSRNIVFVYPDRTIEHYPLPDKALLLSIDYITEVALLGNDLYIFNCQSPDQSNMDLYSLIRFDLKSKTFNLIAENLPYLRANVVGEKVYAITRGEVNDQKLTLYRIDNEQIKAIQTIQMEKNDISVDFKKTNRNEWFSVIIKGSKSDLTRHVYQCFIEDDRIKWDYLGAFYTENWGDFRLERWDDNRLLIGTSTPGYPALILDTHKRNLSSFPLNTITINHILVDRDSSIWFSTEDGFYQCSRNFLESYRLGLGRNDNISGVIKDSRGNVWFSSYTYGFWRVDDKGNLHRPKTASKHEDLNIRFGFMGNCEDDKGRVYQTSDKGLAVSNLKNPNNLDIINTGISLAVFRDKDNGKIYFGGKSDNSLTLNTLSDKRELSSYSSGYRHIVSICRDGNRRLRLGVFSGEAWFDEEKMTVVPDTVKRLYNGVISMALDEKGILWKGTTNGLFAEDKQGNDRKISDGRVIFVIHYNNRYIIWGIKNNLYFLDLEAYHNDSNINIRTFGFFDGFDMLECGQNGASIDYEGYVWLAGSDKAIRFLPEKIMKMPQLQAKKPYLAAIYNANKNSEWALLQNKPLIELANEENFLRFDILQASVTAPDKLIFRYKLIGYNEQWSNSDKHSFIFQNLPFGEYRLEIQSSFDDGQNWSESEFSPVITIDKPFFLSFSGLLLIILAFLSIAALIIYYTRRISIRKEEEMRKIEQLKFRAVQANFIPHFTGNVLNSISALISKDVDLSRKYIARFSDFSKMTMSNSDKLCRSIQDEVKYALLYLELEKLRFGESLEYDAFVEPDVDTQKMMPSMILQTFCENAIKHGLRPKEDGGKVEINIYTESDFVVLAVEDDGIGREQAKLLKTEGTKIGLKIVQQQLDIFNKNKRKKAYLKIIDLLNEASQPSGTRFELYIP